MTLTEKTSSKTSTSQSVDSNSESPKKPMKPSKKILMSTKINSTSTTETLWTSFNSHTKSGLLKKIKNKLQEEYKIMPKSLQIFWKSKSKSKIWRNSNFNKTNKKYKKFIKTINLMSFTKTSLSRFQSPSKLLINTQQYCRKRKNRRAKWLTRRKSSNNLMKSEERNKKTFLQSKTLSNPTQQKRSIISLNPSERKDNWFNSQDTRLTWTEMRAKNQVTHSCHKCLKRISQQPLKNYKPGNFLKGNFRLTQ